MNSEEFISELEQSKKGLYKISNALESEFGISNNPDYDNLKNHVQVFCNVAKDVLGQVKDKIKEQKAKRSTYIKKKKS